jgi:hypothetical protein
VITRLFAAVVLAVTLVACGGGDDGGSGSSTAAGGADTVITIAFDGGEPVDDVWRTDIDLGDRVQILVDGEVDEQVHVHGYDLYIEPGAADPTLEFDALIPGRFEIELEQSGRLLLEITVS